MRELTPTIGLEVHVQLNTDSKIFCGCPTRFGAQPNSQVCPVCLGMPGVLPVLNRQVLLLGIRTALGLNCSVRDRAVFHRKNYFYPDLPKGYQISQYDLPLGSNGYVEAEGQRVRVHRVHMEEDAGKLVHKPGEQTSLVDLNRAGVPLLEIVSEPDLRDSARAYAYLKTLKGILQYLGVSDCDMEKGSLRCDANVSVSDDPQKLGTKVEIKNLNSFRAVARALDYEIARQREVIAGGGRVAQETRLWDDAAGVTRGMRSKEFAHDYRYFPEPDLPPVVVESAWVAEIRRTLPELPRQRAERLTALGLSEADAAALTAAQGTADYFEAALKASGKGAAAKPIANWILGDLAREVNARGAADVAALGFGPERLVELITLVDSGKISGKMAKELLVECLKSGISPKALVEKKGLSQVTDKSALTAAAEEVIREQAKAVEDYRGGKETTLMFLVGQLMRKTRGAASPAVAQELLKELLAR